MMRSYLAISPVQEIIDLLQESDEKSKSSHRRLPNDRIINTIRAPVREVFQLVMGLR